MTTDGTIRIELFDSAGTISHGHGLIKFTIIRECGIVTRNGRMYIFGDFHSTRNENTARYFETSQPYTITEF